MKTKIKEYFTEAIRMNMTLDSEFKSAILRHDRTNTYLENMSGELAKAQQRLIRKGKILRLETMKNIVYDMSDVFVSSIKIEAQQRHESVLAKLARQEEAQKKADMDATIAGKPQGDYEELIEPRKVTSGAEKEKS